MSVFLRVLRMLTMVVWVGGLIFFAFVLAPIAFRVLPSTHEAGTVVGATLRVLNETGHLCGFLFLFATIRPWVQAAPRMRRLILIQMLLVVGMIAASMYVQAGIIPAMERDRIAAGGDVDAATPDNPARLDFELLHPLSERVEGAVLLLGLAVVVMMGFEDGAIGVVRAI